jgi:uncharacterized membrane protein YgcG
MKKIALIFTLLIGLFFSTLNVSAGNTGVDITHMTVTMDVNENGLISVDMLLVLDITGYGIHGPAVYIPQSYDTTWTIDGVETPRTYYFPVQNIKVYDSKYSTEIDEYDNVIIYIGDADVTVSGVKTYHYSYDIQTRDLDLNGLQAFYMNIVGTGWSDPIGLVDFSITLPKGWPSEPFFYTGPTGSGINDTVDYKIVGNTLTGSFDLGMQSYSGITIYEYLTDKGDYFTFIPPFDFSPIALIILALFSALLFIVFQKFGKDDKPVITVEFNPIPGLSSSQAGYIYDGSVDTKDVVSLIIEWANKGYLDITEDEKNKENFTLTKLKDMNESEIRAEKTLFNDLFKGRTAVTNKQLQNTFYQAIANAKMDIARYFNGNPQRNIFSKKATLFKVLFGILTMIPAALVVGSTVYVSTYRGELAFISGIAIFVTGSILVLLWSITAKRWPSLSKASRFFSFIACGFVSVIFALIFLLIMVLNSEDLSTLFIIKIIVTFGFSAFNIVMVSYMDKRTELGVDYLGKILGLKQFIETAEKDRLEMLVEQDPAYFYKLLPYAYVFNVTDIWSKKFESIAIEGPSWYHGGNNMMTPMFFMNRFNRTMNTMNRSMTSVPQSKGRAGGSFGGGGGGFSGGGFGGGGGGHW